MASTLTQSRTIRSAGLLATAAVYAVGSLLIGTPSAQADGFSLGAFDQYGLLVNNGVAGGGDYMQPTNANIGIGNVSGAFDLGNGVVNGQVDCSGNCSSATINSNIAGIQPGSLSPTGAAQPASVNSDVANVQAAIAAAGQLSSVYGAEASQGTAVSLAGNATINATTGFRDATGAYVFTAPTFAPGNGNSVTVNGAASQYVVIDVTAASGNSLNGALALTGGITPDHVLLNFIGSGSTVFGGANGATLSATIVAPNEGIQLTGLTIDGRLFGGAAGEYVQCFCGASINQPPLTATPLPPALPLYAAGLGLLAFIGWRQTRRAAVTAA